jgi:putative RNA 2'-phosphotransferase
MKQVSRFLSNVLRHKPENAGIELDRNGWTNVEILISNLNEMNYVVDMESLIEIVEVNDKQRFAFNDDKTLIRASQGHSVKVDLGYLPSEPPHFLYHGTVEKDLQLILKDGLKKMSRHATHLSVDIPTAINVGSRRGDAILLKINSKLMNFDGFKFYQSANGVWLTDFVPSKYISVTNNVK